MSPVEPRLGPNPDWEFYSQRMITEEEYAVLGKTIEQSRLFEGRFQSTVHSLNPNNTAQDPALKGPKSSSALEKNYYRKDSLSSAANLQVNNLNDPKASASFGVPVLLKPAEHLMSKSVSKSLTLEPSIGTSKPTDNPSRQEIKALNEKGLFTEIKNYFWNLFGWNTTPAADTSPDSQLVGSPKEQKIRKHEAELLSNALDQLSVAINKLITKPSEESKDLDSEESDEEAEIVALKQLLGEVEILKRILASFRDEVKSKDFETVLASDEIDKIYNEGKALQEKHLNNDREIEERLKTSKILKWIEYGTDGVLAVTGIASIVLMFTVGGAAALPVLSLIAGTASIGKGTSMGINAYQKNETNLRRSENEGYTFERNQFNIAFGELTKEMSNSFKNTSNLYLMLVNLVESKRKTIQVAQQISR